MAEALSYEWFLVANNDKLSIKIKDQVTLGEDERGLLTLESRNPEQRWVTLAIDGNGELVISKLFSGWQLESPAAWVSTEPGVVCIPGTQLELPNNKVYISHDLLRGKVAQELIVKPAPKAKAKPSPANPSPANDDLHGQDSALAAIPSEADEFSILVTESEAAQSTLEREIDAAEDQHTSSEADGSREVETREIESGITLESQADDVGTNENTEETIILYSTLDDSEFPQTPERDKPDVDLDEIAEASVANVHTDNVPTDDVPTDDVHTNDIEIDETKINEIDLDDIKIDEATIAAFDAAEREVEAELQAQTQVQTEEPPILVDPLPVISTPQPKVTTPITRDDHERNVWAPTALVASIGLVVAGYTFYPFGGEQEAKRAVKPVPQIELLPSTSSQDATVAELPVALPVMVTEPQDRLPPQAQPLVAQTTGLTGQVLAQELAEAKMLISQGFINWPDRSAVSILGGILAVQPDHEEALSLLNDATAKYLSEAQKAYGDGFDEAAFDMLRQVEQFHPNSDRIPVLRATWGIEPPLTQ
ncbi:MAG: hypothetical protein GKR90_11220 [Pseudomonadales bacterium]|nr:hypothetical protein [Pseudomonadales bacterium]